ncbi:hypothetical protein C7H19_05595 [Aphanothece hegewaldii CCALA 016]|uniref:Integron cassette protein VCH-CASS1 chain domain-containing protein n=1 Tax=Aphanothece hegewaldii CCALA 016 TaxID=2107694 RepID=A0A2T1M188_9CHRO|nr:hypothetical protein [Aphanothece hegewaldii]PSF38458.1 hypothetical protein C7H19_05595 [Aphanothece hegewaldii CCALA 016]
MALKLTDINMLQDYINGMMARVDHHGGPVNEIILALIGAILWKKDEDRPILIREKNGSSKNLIWTHIKGVKYAFCYNHFTQEIEMYKNGMKGELITTFTNETSFKDIRKVFSNL